MNLCLKCKETTEADAIYGLHPRCFVQSFELTQTLQFSDLDPKKASSFSSGTDISIKKQNTFFHGNYRKYSARLGQSDYILKVKEARYPELPLVEYLCNQIADLLQIEVPQYHLINFNGELTFVTRNFMQDYIGSLHHIYKFLPPGEEHHNCEEIIHVILSQTQRLADVASFIQITLFDALTGNNDRHGRNLGIIETASTKKLAPMYDNPSCIGIEDDFFLAADINPSGSIWTKTSKAPKPADYIEQFIALGYESVVTQFCKKVASQEANVIKTINETVLLSDARKNAFAKLFQKRMREFENVR